MPRPSDSERIRCAHTHTYITDSDMWAHTCLNVWGIVGSWMWICSLLLLSLCKPKFDFSHSCNSLLEIQTVPDEESLPNTAFPPPDATSSLWHCGVLPATVYRDPLLHLLLFRGELTSALLQSLERLDRTSFGESSVITKVSTYGLRLMDCYFVDLRGGLRSDYRPLYWRIAGEWLIFPFFPIGYEGAVSSSQGLEKTVMEVPHQVHDVVPEARGAQDHHWWVRAGTSQITFKRLFIY